jgi:hypothetical protein
MLKKLIPTKKREGKKKIKKDNISFILKLTEFKSRSFQAEGTTVYKKKRKLEKMYTVPLDITNPTSQPIRPSL